MVTKTNQERERKGIQVGGLAKFFFPWTSFLISCSLLWGNSIILQF